MADLNVRLCSGVGGVAGRIRAAKLRHQSRPFLNPSLVRYDGHNPSLASKYVHRTTRHRAHHNLPNEHAQPNVVCSAAVTAGDGDYRYGFDWQLPTLDPALLASLGTILAVMVSGISNRVLYRMALVPMKDYVFYLAQFQTFGYVLVYFCMLYLRYRSGKVTPAMLESPPRLLFLVVGACEALAQVLLMVGAAQLPGAVLPLVSQSVLLWNMVFSTFILHHRVRLTQVVGAALVIFGVVLAAMPSSASSCAVMSCDVRYIGLCLLSFAFPSLSSIVKERIFAEGQARLGGQPLDIFVVNSYGSAAQAFFVLLMLPVLTSLRGMPLPDLPSYLARGSQCFMGLAPSCGADCSGAPLLPILYVVSNLVFNVSILKLLRNYGTVAASLSMASLVPLTIWVFSLQLPFLESAVLGPMFVLGTLILMGGLMIYNFEHYSTHFTKRFGLGSKAA